MSISVQLLTGKIRIRELFLVVATVAVAGVASIWWLGLAQKYAAADVSWRQHSQVMGEAHKALADLNRSIGYGGVIHHFKNYVLRHDPGYEAKIEKSLVEFDRSFKTIELLLTAPQEFAALYALRDVIDEYRGKYLLARDLVAEGRSSAEIDALVRVDDTPALSAQVALQQALDQRGEFFRLETQAEFVNLDRWRRLGLWLLVPVSALIVLYFALLRSHRKAEAQLEARRLEAAKLLESTPDPLIAVNAEGVICRANRRAAGFFGYPQAVLLGKQVESLMPAEYRLGHVLLRREFVDAPDLRAMAPNRSIRVLLADGSEKDVSITLSHAVLGDEALSMASLRDITEETRLKNELARKSTRAALLSEVAKLGIWEWDIRTGAFTLDDACARLFKIDAGREDLALENFLDLVHLDDRELVQQILTDPEARAKSPECVFRTTELLGRCAIRLVVNFDQDAETKDKHLTGVCIDVTHLVETEAALVDALGEARRANETKTSFLANMSHEIRTPMNAVLGMLTLLDDSALDEKQKNYVKSSRRAATSLLDILNDILDLTRLGEGKVALRNDPFELEKAVCSTIDMFAITAAAKGLDLRLRMRPDVYCNLYGDSLRLTQVLNNLVGNAIKFTDVGSIGIEVSLLWESEDNCGLRFAVTDTGIGLSEQDITRISKPFIQGDMSATRQAGGSGLGLAISNGLLELMASRIEIKSEKDQGSQFWFDVEFARQNDKRIAELLAADRNVHVICADAYKSETLGDYLASWGLRTSYSLGVQQSLADIGASDGENIDLCIFSGEAPGSDDWLREVRQLIELLRLGSSKLLVLMVPANQRMRYDFSQENPSVVVLAEPPTPSVLFNILSQFIFGRQAAQAETRPASGDAGSALRGRRILVAEDVETNQIVIKDFLETFGIEVDLAADGAQALDKALNGRYDAVLMDFHMPVMDGLEATRKIRESIPARNLPIIAMTAAAFETDRKKALECGMSDHIAKPVKRNLLEEVLIKHLVTGAGRVLAESGSGSDLAAASGSGGAAARPFQITSASIPKSLQLSSVKTLYSHNAPLLLICLQSFRRDFGHWSEDIKQAVDRADYVLAKGLAHKLKGAAANIGADEIHDITLHLEHSLGQRSCQGLELTSNKLENLIHQIDECVAASQRGVARKRATRSREETLNIFLTLKSMVEQRRYITGKKLAEYIDYLSDFVNQDVTDELQNALIKFDYPAALQKLTEIASKLGERKVI